MSGLISSAATNRTRPIGEPSRDRSLDSRFTNASLSLTKSFAGGLVGQAFLVYQDNDNKVWQHYRFVMRVGNVISVVYLFGREEFFQDQKDRTWTGQGDWFTAAVFHRM